MGLLHIYPRIYPIVESINWEIILKIISHLRLKNADSHHFNAGECEFNQSQIALEKRIEYFAFSWHSQQVCAVDIFIISPCDI